MASDNQHRSSLFDRSDGVRSGRLPRWMLVLAVTLVVAGLTLGATFGGPASPASLYLAAFLGGLLYRQSEYVPGREVYGNVILAAFFGTALSSLVLSGMISWLLGVGFLNVLWATALELLLNAVSVVVIGLAGYAAAIAVDFAGVRARTTVAAALLVVGGVLFVAVQFRLAGIGPETGSGATAVLSDEARSTVQLLQVAGLLTGGLGLVGFLSLLGSRERLRSALVGLLVVGLLVGGIGVGRVHGQISHSFAVEELAAEMTVEVTDAAVEDQEFRVALAVTNPSDTEVVVTGSFVRAHNAEDAQLAYGSGIPSGTSHPVPVAPGETATVTYTVGLTPDQADRLAGAVIDGDVTVSGRTSVRTADVDPLVASATDPGFVVRFECDTGTDCAGS